MTDERNYDNDGLDPSEQRLFLDKFDEANIIKENKKETRGMLW